jgi:uroporphyrinogen-III synthase
LGAENLLKGRRIAITRPREQSQPLAHALESLGAKALIIPAIRIAPPESWSAADSAFRNIESYHWLLFTSANGVAAFLDRYNKLFTSRASLAHLRIGVVGGATRRRVEADGFAVTLQSAGGTADDLARRFRDYFESDTDLAGLRILLPASNIGRDVVERELMRLGCIVDVIKVYRTLPAESLAEDLHRVSQSAGIDDIVFASPSAVDSFTHALSAAGLSDFLRDVRVTCIGRVTANAAIEHGLTVHGVAEEPTVECLIDAICGKSDLNTE